MDSLIYQSTHECTSVSNVFEGLEVEPTINLARSLRQYMQSSTQSEFTMRMDDTTYGYKVGPNNFDPETIIPEVITLGKKCSTVVKQLRPDQEIAFENYILKYLTCMVYGSNMIESAGSDLNITTKLCIKIFCGNDKQDDISNEDFLELKLNLIQNGLQSDTTAILRSGREIVQHAKAASYMISRLCIHNQDLSEDIILETHKILTYKIDAHNTPWEEYSGVYRRDEVSAGLHQFPHHSLVSYKMTDMIRELKSDLQEAIKKGKIDPIDIASKYCHIFVNIHPFMDGNGRMCRLILNFILLRLGIGPVCIGDEEEDRSLYRDVGCNGSGLEEVYGDLDEEEKQLIGSMHKELSAFVIMHVKDSMSDLLHLLL
ncbi:hypothetical protein N7490_011027 [Penicillium lividum]|nr:hypothetical protein N7490_011027 [Penicillium lividum]